MRTKEQSKSNKHRGALLKQIKLERNGEIKLLLDRIDQEEKDELLNDNTDGKITPLIHALNENVSLPTIELLINYGASWWKSSMLSQKIGSEVISQEMYPLEMVIEKDRADVLEVFLENASEEDVARARNETILMHIAAVQNKEGCLEILLKDASFKEDMERIEAIKDDGDDRKRTPLYLALQHTVNCPNEIECALILLQHGADLGKEISDGTSSFDFLEKLNKSVRKYVSDRSYAKLMENSEKKDPAILRGKTGKLIELLEKKHNEENQRLGNKNIPKKDGNLLESIKKITPEGGFKFDDNRNEQMLYFLSFICDVGVIKHLSENGLNIKMRSPKDPRKIHILELAMKNRKYGFISYLINLGCLEGYENINDYFKRFMDIAIHHEENILLSLLLSKGAVNDSSYLAYIIAQSILFNNLTGLRIILNKFDKNSEIINHYRLDYQQRILVFNSLLSGKFNLDLFDDGVIFDSLKDIIRSEVIGKLTKSEAPIVKKLLSRLLINSKWSALNFVLEEYQEIVDKNIIETFIEDKVGELSADIFDEAVKILKKPVSEDLLGAIVSSGNSSLEKHVVEIFGLTDERIVELKRMNFLKFQERSAQTAETKKNGRMRSRSLDNNDNADGNAEKNTTKPRRNSIETKVSSGKTEKDGWPELYGVGATFGERAFDGGSNSPDISSGRKYMEDKHGVKPGELKKLRKEKKEDDTSGLEGRGKDKSSSSFWSKNSISAPVYTWNGGKTRSDTPGIKPIRGDRNAYLYIAEDNVLAQGCSENTFRLFFAKYGAKFDDNHIRVVKDGPMINIRFGKDREIRQLPIKYEIKTRASEDRILAISLSSDQGTGVLVIGCKWLEKGLHKFSDRKKLDDSAGVITINLPEHKENALQSDSNESLSPPKTKAEAKAIGKAEARKEDAEECIKNLFGPL